MSIVVDGILTETATEECVPWIEARFYPEQVIFYFLAAWNHAWIQHEQIRSQFNTPPWLMFKTPEERVELGYGPPAIITPKSGLVGINGGKLDS